MSELVMDLRLVWDSRKLKEIDEAKAEYRKYRAEGYEIVKPDGTPLDRFMNLIPLSAESNLKLGANWADVSRRIRALGLYLDPGLGPLERPIMRQLLCILCIIVSIMAQPNDEFWDSGPLIHSLESYVIIEHNSIKRSIDSIPGLDFQWRICSFAGFPIIKG
jgi:hypothetical protein